MNTTRTGYPRRVALCVCALGIAAFTFAAVPPAAYSQDAGQYLRAFIDRLNEGTAKGDYDYAVGLQAEDGVRVHPTAGVIKGRAALRDYFAHLATRWKDTHETITWMTANGNHAAAAITWEATNRKSGKRIKLPMALLADFDANGMIKWSRVYFYLGSPKKKK